TRVPADGTEHSLWTVRGWAEVALGILTLGMPDSFVELDAVVAEVGLSTGGRFAERLGRLRTVAGPAPRWYPRVGRSRPMRPVDELAWSAARLLLDFCTAIDGVVADSRPHRRATGADDGTNATTSWAASLRPSPTEHFRILDAGVDPGLVWRTWMH